MKILKYILIVVGAIIAVFLIIPLFVKNDYQVVRTVTINKSKNDVFAYIKMLKNHDNFNVWSKMDPKMTKTFDGTDGTVGFHTTWKSANGEVGEGEQTIKSIVEGSTVEYDLHFIKPMDGKANANMKCEELTPTSTKVTWEFKSRMSYPMNIILLFMDMDQILGTQLQKGLDDLKKIQEA